MGSDCGLAVLMRSVVGPSYDVAGVGPDVMMHSAHGLGSMVVSHVDHEYGMTDDGMWAQRAPSVSVE